MTNGGPRGKEGVGFLLFSVLPSRVLCVCGGGEEEQEKTSKHQQKRKAQPSRQTSGRRPPTDNLHTKTQLLITTHMLKCFIWTRPRAIVLKLRFLGCPVSLRLRENPCSGHGSVGAGRLGGQDSRGHTLPLEISHRSFTNTQNTHIHADILPTET